MDSKRLTGELALFTNGQLRKTLAGVRSLGIKEIPSISAEETRMNITGFSKFCTKNLKYPAPDKNPEAFLKWLAQIANRHQVTVFFPMDDAAMDLAVLHQDRLTKSMGMVVPPLFAYQQARDKWQAGALAEKAGLSCPKTVLPQSVEDLEVVAQEIGFPVVVKARNGSGSRGIRVANSIEELRFAYESVAATYENPMLQERIPTGPRYDVCLLFDQASKLVAHFAQKEIRHFPVEMGPSTVQQSVQLPELVQKCADLMSSIGWRGIAEFEFMYDVEKDRYVFMEINTRFWNSLALAVQCGIDFPYYYYCLARELPVIAPQHYPLGQYCRWLLPGDLLHYLLNPARRNMQPPLLPKKETPLQDDILSRTDPMPFFGFLASVLRYLPDPHMWKFFFQR